MGGSGLLFSGGRFALYRPPASAISGPPAGAVPWMRRGHPSSSHRDMRRTAFCHRWLLLVLTGLLCPAVARAQGLTSAGPESPPDWSRQRPWASAFDGTAPPDAAAARARANRIQLFRI